MVRLDKSQFVDEHKRPSGRFFYPQKEVNRHDLYLSARLYGLFRQRSGRPYNARFEEISMKYDGLKASCETLEEAIRDKTARRAEAEDFIRELMKQPELITEFDPIAYHILVDRMTVFKKDRVVVRFKNGVEIEA